MRTSTTASEANPTRSTQPFVAPILVNKSHSFSKKLPEPFSTPNNTGNWPTMMVSASPTMKPLSTGSDMKLARNPRRSNPAATAATPVVMASAAVRATKAPDPRVANSATAAAERAAVADMGPVFRCFELPKAA